MRHHHLLYVDDNPGDIELVREAFRRHGGRVTVEAVENGAQAIDYLARKGARFADAPIPDLVLLDLRLPVLDGAQVAAEMRRLSAWRDIPIIILSSSAERGDVDAAYAAGATLYITKPAAWDGYERMADSIARLMGLGASAA
jgi:two-component system response regulator